MSDYIAQTDATLVAYTNNFQSGIAGTNAAAVGLTTPQSTNFASLNLAWTNSFAALQDGATRSPAAVITKDQCKKAVVADLRQLAGIIQKFPGTTDQQRTALGLTIRRHPAPIPTPSTSPRLTITGVNGSTVGCQVYADATAHKAMPVGVKHVIIFAYVGATPPTVPSEYVYQGISQRTTFDVPFNSVAAGSRVWIIAAWANARTQTGPSCQAVGATLQYSNAMTA